MLSHFNLKCAYVRHYLRITTLHFVTTWLTAFCHMAPKLAASSGTCSHEVHPTFSAQSRTHSTRTAHAVPGSERSLVSPTSILHFHIICSSHELNVLYYSIHAVGGRIITTSTHTHTVPSTSSTSTLPHTYPAAG